MNIFIAGIDGYLGWSLAVHLAARGHVISGMDAGFRRRWVEEMGSGSAIPILDLRARAAAFERRFGRPLVFSEGDLRDFRAVAEAIAQSCPDAVVHMGECPSAPYSMRDAETAAFVQLNNVGSTLNLLYAVRQLAPEAHLLKMGTMGEYGTPNVDIPEGFFEVEFRGRTDRLPFPRQAWSWYHWSKVHGSNNLMFACELWNLRATDVMQGVVYGTRTHSGEWDPDFATRFDYDQCFGTLVNRCCAQALIGEPLLVYGDGSQRRGFIALRDSMQCLTLALESPPARGEYRVFNQFDEVYSISELSQKVRAAGNLIGLNPVIETIENPREEKRDHYYNPECKKLVELGFRRTRCLEEELQEMLSDLTPHRQRIMENRHCLLPTIQWRK